MENCINCGEKRKGDERFCTSCGKPFALETVSETNQSKPTTAKAPKKISSKQKKRRIALLLSVGILIVGLIGTHLFLQSKYEVSNTLTEMNQSYVSGEKAKFLSYFEMPEGTVGHAEGFYSFIEEEGWEGIRNQMKSQSDRLEEEGLTDIVLDSQGNKLISVTKEPIVFGLYQDIEFLIHPIAVEVELPLEGTSITLEDKTAEGESAKIGDFLPGDYPWEAKVPSVYGEIGSKGTINVSGDGKNNYTFRPDLKAGMVKVSSDVPSAVLWVNGKSTEKKVEELDTVGPLPLDGTVELIAETANDKGEKLKSDKLKVSSKEVYLKFAHVQEKVAAERNQKVEEQKLQQLKEDHESSVTAFIDEFRLSFESALNSADFSYIADYFPSGSKIQEDYLADIDRHFAMDTYYYYDFQSNTITDFKIVDENTFLVTTAEMFYFDSSEDRLKYNKTKAYRVKYQNSQYYIQEINQLASEKVEI